MDFAHAGIRPKSFWSIRIMQDPANESKSVADQLYASIQKDARRGQRVGVVMGGRSSERAISLRTGEGFVDALTRLGYEPRVYDLPADLAKLVADRPEALLLGLHGGAGENGVMQGFRNSGRCLYRQRRARLGARDGQGARQGGA